MHLKSWGDFTSLKSWAQDSLSEKGLGLRLPESKQFTSAPSPLPPSAGLGSRNTETVKRPANRADRHPTGTPAPPRTAERFVMWSRLGDTNCQSTSLFGRSFFAFSQLSQFAKTYGGCTHRCISARSLHEFTTYISIISIIFNVDFAGERLPWS